jgi:hypothetical protein
MPELNRRTVLIHWLRGLPIRRASLIRVLFLVGPIWLQTMDSTNREHAEQLLFRGLESTGEVHYIRDASGNVTGLRVRLHGPAAAGATAHGTL